MKPTALDRFTSTEAAWHMARLIHREIGSAIAMANRNPLILPTERATLAAHSRQAAGLVHRLEVKKNRAKALYASEQLRKDQTR